ncbi:MAG: c-type cytochrome [Flavobacteriaceae bacterium]
MKFPLVGILGLLIFLICACRPSYEEPRVSLERYHLEDGFSMQVVASEPLLRAPVAIDFDNKGRMWVVGMSDFMTSLDGGDDQAPTGTIKILEDRDRDGIMDHAKVFMDSLRFPRALALVYGGVLYAEPPNLWFVGIENDRPIQRVLVDSLYAVEGNPEHQPNGLHLNLDNWIYNAKSHYRYRRIGEKWVKEATSFRGQWGISHDNFGRLYYNDNSTQLMGDYVLPNLLSRNPYWVPKKGISRTLTGDQRVYPMHPGLVNRGYVKGVLNADSLLVNVTAACGPLVYRGGAFTEEYDQNAFVCIPEANALKRNILSFHGDSISAQQAWEEKEFLVSTDEGFRPVNLTGSVDGNLYVVDMHRGVIQHHAYMSPYMKKGIVQRKLDTMVNMGRILKIWKEGQVPMDPIDFDTLTAKELVSLLSHKNGWIRDRAQHCLVYRNHGEAIPDLKKLSATTENPLAQIHALRTLEGLNALDFDVLIEAGSNCGPEVASHVVVLMQTFVAEEHWPRAKELFLSMWALKDKGLDIYLATVLGQWKTASGGASMDLMQKILSQNRNSMMLVEAALSGLNTLDFLEGDRPREVFGEPHALWSTSVEQLMANMEGQRKNRIFSTQMMGGDTRTRGAKMFKKLCAACHGIDGAGLTAVAPPLEKSEYVADPKTLGLVLLHGLKGPIQVAGVEYTFNNAMPGLMGNTTVSDADIVDIISYVTNAFSDRAHVLDHATLEELKKVRPTSGEYTAEELNAFLKRKEN